MGASFRNSGQIEMLAGCDRLTIGPQFLEELSNDDKNLARKLHPNKVNEEIDKPCLPENFFRLGLNHNAMATEKLSEGIRLFIADQERLEGVLQSRQ
jgi:transaldolase